MVTVWAGGDPYILLGGGWHHGNCLGGWGLHAYLWGEGAPCLLLGLAGQNGNGLGGGATTQGNCLGGGGTM